MHPNTLPSQGTPLLEQLQIKLKSNRTIYKANNKCRKYCANYNFNYTNYWNIIISCINYLALYLRLYFILYLLYRLLSAGIPNFPNDESLTKFSCESAIIFSQKSSFNINMRTPLSVPT